MKTAHILLVEDNDGDIILTQEAFEESKVINQISVVKNGKDALDFLHKRNGFEKVESPDIILLDINIPIFSGHEVLQKIKNDPQLKKIPVIILTTSSNEMDVNKAYENHTNSFVTKPIEMKEFLEAVLQIEEFWLQLCKLPVT